MHSQAPAVGGNGRMRHQHRGKEPTLTPTSRTVGSCSSAGPSRRSSSPLSDALSSLLVAARSVRFPGVCADGACVAAVSRWQGHMLDDACGLHLAGHSACSSRGFQTVTLTLRWLLAGAGGCGGACCGCCSCCRVLRQHAATDHPQPSQLHPIG